MYRKMLLLATLLTAGCDAYITDLRPVDAGDVGDAGDAAGVQQTLATAAWEEVSSAIVTGTVALVRSADGDYQLRVSEDFSSETYSSVVMVLSPFDTLPERLEPDSGDQNLGDIVGPGADTWNVPSLPSFPMYAFVYSRAAGEALARAELRP